MRKIRNWIVKSLGGDIGSDRQDWQKRLSVFHKVARPIWTPRQYDRLAEEGYQQNVIVYRCVTLIARGAATAPWLLYRGDQESTDHKLLRLLARPNATESGVAFIESAMTQLLLSGNLYIKCVRGYGEEPVKLYTLRPDRVRVEAGQGVYPKAYLYEVEGETTRYPVNQITGESEICHIKLFNPLNDWYGMSPIEAAAQSIDQHNTVAGHNLALLQNGGRPSGALMVNDKNGIRMTPEQRDDLRRKVYRAYEGSKNAGRVLVLEGAFEWKEMGLSPRDLDFVEGKGVCTREIAQAFGVPPMLVGAQGDATFANYKEARYHLWEDTILPHIDRLASELSNWLAPMFGEKLALAVDHDAIPALTPRRESKWAQVSGAPFLTLNEKRQAVGYTPLAGGDFFLEDDDEIQS